MSQRRLSRSRLHRPQRACPGPTGWIAGSKVPFAHVPYREDLAIVNRRRGSDPWGHGTHVASIIAGQKVGVSPEARLFVAGAAEGHSLTSHMRRIVSALDWLLGELVSAQHRGYPIVLNLSLGFEPDLAAGRDTEDFGNYLEMIESAVSAFTDGNVLVVAAIGNDGEDRYRLPGGMPNVLAVGAIDEPGREVMHFSGNVPANCPLPHVGPDIMGFGEEISGAYGRDISGSSMYACLSGTSQAAAYVSGIAGLYWSMDRRMSAGDVREQILATAAPVPRDQAESAHRWGAGFARFVPDPELVRRWNALRSSDRSMQPPLTYR